MGAFLVGQDQVAGERIMLFAKNGPEWSMAYFGIPKLGATAVPIANESTVAEVVNVARASGAAGILIGDDLHEKRSGLTRALREANKYNIHTDRHLIGLPCLTGEDGGATLVEAPFAVYQTDQEGETRLFASGLYRDSIVAEAGDLKFRDKLVVLDTFAVPSLLATPL